MKLLISLLFVCMPVKADIIINALVKVGPNGYKSAGNYTSETYNYQKNKVKESWSYTEDTRSVSNRYGITPGVGIQYVPHGSGVAVGIGYYFDETGAGSLGWKF